MDTLVIIELVALLLGSTACIIGVFVAGYLYGQLKAYKDISGEFDNLGITVQDSIDEYTSKVSDIIKGVN